MQDTSSNTSAQEQDQQKDQEQQAPAPEKKKDPPFAYPEARPMHQALKGVWYDFNMGARVMADKDYDPDSAPKLTMTDLDSGCVLHSAPLKPGYCVACSKKFMIRYALELRDRRTDAVLWRHELDLRDKDVLVQLPVKGALGDSIAWFSVLERFRLRHGCRLHVLMPPHVSALFIPQYPEMLFESLDSVKTLKPYASYYLGLFFGGDTNWQPYDFRTTGLARTAAYILGLDDVSEIPPRVSVGPRTIPERYVCIAVQASAHAKHWCNPAGWRQLVDALRDRGYRVLCIDKSHETGAGDVWHQMPPGAEDFVGNRPLQERLDLIAHADFFVGLSSGLGWIAWCAGVPVVRISGICAPWGEFPTPYFVQPRHTCHGCWNDTRYEFDHKDFMWCPVNKGTPKAYECTRAITAGMVDRTIDRIPGVLPHSGAWRGDAF